MINSLYVKVAVVALAIIIGIASYYWGPFKGQKDNPVEQLAEEAIKEETNLTIDLTPGDTQKKDDTNANN